MKTKQDAIIQFSGYPLTVVEPGQKIKKAELTVVKPLPGPQITSSKKYVADDPKYWDIDWFNSYE